VANIDSSRSHTRHLEGVVDICPNLRSHGMVADVLMSLLTGDVIYRTLTGTECLSDGGNSCSIV
jgi:hypothetical protein